MLTITSVLKMRDLGDQSGCKTASPSVTLKVEKPGVQPAVVVMIGLNTHPVNLYILNIPFRRLHRVSLLSLWTGSEPVSLWQGLTHSWFISILNILPFCRC